MSEKLLFLNNTAHPAAVPPILERLRGDDLEMESAWAARSEFPQSLDRYAGAFVSGSPRSSYDREPWIEREHEVLSELVCRGTPVMGICFGSQILASSLFGRDQVYRRSACEVGYAWLDVAPEAAGDPVCTRLERRMRMFVWHNDDVRADHPDMQVLATSGACANQVWRHRDLPVWGIQGHVEVTVDGAPRWFERNRAHLEADGVDVDRLVDSAEDTANARTMLERFLDVCRRYRDRAVSGAGIPHPRASCADTGAATPARESWPIPRRM